MGARSTTVAGALTLGAGLAHVVAATEHDDAAVVLFILAAAAQVLLGGVVLLSGPRWALAGVMAVNAGAAVAWLASRTAGLPLLGQEAAGAPDVVTTGAELVAVVAAAAALRVPSVARRRLSPVLVLAVVPALVGLAAPATHDHGGAGEVADGHGHAPASTLASDPVFRGVDTAHSSVAELEAAKRLIESTRVAVAARFPDQASLVAAGYRSIGDGRVTPFDHFIKPEYLEDGRELDPERVESVVLERTPAGWRVASAMYILETGKTMADVPDVAGGLTVWHDHQNLCWDRSGTRLAGLLVNGACFPGGTLHPTPPMLHVWLADHPCGPFAGIEGHGGGCAHGHAS
jgi:hypothetical protein